MKLSFSIPSKPSKSAPRHKPTSQDEDQVMDEEKEKQYVTEFDPSKDASGKNNRKLFIPPKENEYQPHKRMKNLEHPLSLQSDPDLRFEVESLSVADGGSSVSYGLNLREGTAAATNKEDKNRSLNSTNKDSLLDKLRYDLKRLPEDTGMEEFQDMPIESFGKTLLAGYGWQEGMGIGKNPKEDVKVKYTDKSILRFFSHDSNSTGSRNDGDRNDGDETKQKQKNDDRSRDREQKSDGDKYFVGKDVRIVGGPRDTMIGSKARIVERLDPDTFVLKIAETRKELTLHVLDIADLGSKEEEKCLRKLKNLKVSNVERTCDIDNNGTGVSEIRSLKKERDKRKIDTDIQRGVSWLRSHIRVRIISKDLKRGRLYLKKGEIVDVLGPYVCDISMDESKELVQGVDQDLLETALPRRGGPVLVLYGKHKGKYGSLVQRDLDKEIGVVQDAETRELLNVKLEEIAEYIGDPSYIGY